MFQRKVRTLANENLPRLNPLLLPLPWIVVVILVIAFLVMRYSNDTHTTVAASKTVKVFPQVFMTNVDTRDFDAKGALHYQLKTPLIRHYQINEKSSEKDYTLFDLPQIVFLGDGEKPAWYMTAQAARSHNNGELFTLSTDVLVQQTSQSQGIVSISTAELHLNTREQFAETNKAVTMRSAKTQLETTGLRAYIKQDRIELLSHVTGTYEP
ncbi:MAG: LPS export ABC transporter periplasmic protein LptC [Pseudomonadota bacterium]